MFILIIKDMIDNKSCFIDKKHFLNCFVLKVKKIILLVPNVCTYMTLTDRY